ncbi:hypothetical protein H2248_000052 [Termitomyces sp. 'cryptogamus']|nr:hypothetical protein H2248_000052 [Termitomyces sp. 'cryptogamus']
MDHRVVDCVCKILNVQTFKRSKVRHSKYREFALSTEVMTLYHNEELQSRFFCILDSLGKKTFRHCYISPPTFHKYRQLSTLQRFYDPRSNLPQFSASSPHLFPASYRRSM